jgi:electron transport complex protein RnfC
VAYFLPLIGAINKCTVGMKILHHSKTFAGGIHPSEQKELTENKAFELMPAPKQIILPLNQHLGKYPKPLVKKGSEVKIGELIAEQDGFISSPIHSPVCGKVSKITVGANVSGFPKDEIIIDVSDNNEAILMEPLDVETITIEQIRERVKSAGIVGQGGAAFPTYVKLTPPEGKKIDVVILNGCECEPYLTRDYRFMIERTNDIIAGLKLIMKALGVEKGAIGIEDNKPHAIEKLNIAVQNIPEIEIYSLKTKYPQGAEKMLIKAVTGKEVPPGKLPFDAGAAIQNIGTALAIFDAVVKGEAQTTAAITVSGLGIKEQKNIITKVGTPLIDILEYCGGLTDDAVKVVVGGPMMGIAQYDFNAPVMKATSGILVLTKNEINDHEETPCLRCGKCVDACPLNLVPTRLSRLTQMEKFDEAEKLNITLCMECGTCTYTCPANIPLVQWIRLGKQQVNIIQKARV